MSHASALLKLSVVMAILQCSLDELVAAIKKNLLQRGINVAIAQLQYIRWALLA
jgi:hypothetical protein